MSEELERREEVEVEVEEDVGIKIDGYARSSGAHLRSEQGMSLDDLGEKHYLFRFNHPRDLRWVVENRPWTYDNSLLVLHELKKGESPESILFTSAAFWVQIHELPARFCKESVRHILGAFVGQYVAFDTKTKFSRETPYLRIRVIVDVTKPLAIDKKVRQPRGEWLLGKFRYEKLPTFCFLCGRIGHVERHCAIFYRSANPETLVRRCDATLRADVKKLMVSGGAQWIVHREVSASRSGGGYERMPLGPAVTNLPNHGRPVFKSSEAVGTGGYKPSKSWETSVQEF
ncbi:Uncharacterized protein At4g02000 [Linum grandiflorum]